MGKIIGKEEAFMEDYLPEKILFRDEQIKKLKQCLESENSIPVFLYGPSGSGKTVILKHLVNWLNKTGMEKIAATYIDCTNYRTANAIFQEILFNVSKRIIPNSISNYRLTKMLRHEVEKRKLIVCLDNYEWLKEKEVIEQLLKLKCGLALASHDYQKLDHLFQIIRFEPYSRLEAIKILRERAVQSLKQGSYNHEIQNLIASLCDGDMKRGISILWYAARKAQDENKDNIETCDVMAVLSLISVDLRDEIKRKLSLGEQLVYNVIEENNQITGSDLQRLLKNKFPMSARTFRNYLKNLASCKLIEAIGEKRGRMYRSIQR